MKVSYKIVAYKTDSEEWEEIAAVESTESVKAQYEFIKDHMSEMGIEGLVIETKLDLRKIQ